MRSQPAPLPPCKHTRRYVCARARTRASQVEYGFPSPPWLPRPGTRAECATEESPAVISKAAAAAAAAAAVAAVAKGRWAVSARWPRWTRTTQPRPQRRPTPTPPVHQHQRSVGTHRSNFQQVKNALTFSCMAGIEHTSPNIGQRAVRWMEEREGVGRQRTPVPAIISSLSVHCPLAFKIAIFSDKQQR